MTDFLMVSTADWDNPYWTNKQHVASQLAEAGHRVFYIESLGLRRPTATRRDVRRIARRIARGGRAPRRVRPNLWVWSPLVVPFHSAAAARSLNRALLRAGSRFWCRRIGLSPAVMWTYSPLTTELFDVTAYDRLVYHAVDDIKAQPGMPRAAIARAETELAATADVVFTTARHIQTTFEAVNPRTHYLPNVADFKHFSRALDADTPVPEDLARLPGPRIGFVGAVSSYKLDFGLIRTLAESRPDRTFAFIGEIGEGDPWTDAAPLAALKNVHFLGGRPYASLPGYLKGIDVAILPNARNDYTRSMFPMKFFEYLAAGRPVVSTALPALAEYGHVAALCDDAPSFLSAIEAAFAGNGPSLEDRLAVARQHTYEARTARMLDILESARPAPTPAPVAPADGPDRPRRRECLGAWRAAAPARAPEC